MLSIPGLKLREVYAGIAGLTHAVSHIRGCIALTPNESYADPGYDDPHNILKKFVFDTCLCCSLLAISSSSGISGSPVNLSVCSTLTLMEALPRDQLPLVVLRSLASAWATSLPKSHANPLKHWNMDPGATAVALKILRLVFSGI